MNILRVNTVFRSSSIDRLLMEMQVILLLTLRMMMDFPRPSERNLIRKQILIWTLTLTLTLTRVRTIVQSYTIASDDSRTIVQQSSAIVFRR